MSFVVAGHGLPAQPPPPAPRQPTTGTPLTVTWVGWDGSRWVLSGDLTAQVYLPAGFRGWSMPKLARRTSRSPALAGSRYLGTLADERELFLPVTVNVPGGGQPWYDLDQQFWATMRQDKTGTLEVQQPNGVTRSLPLRFDNDGDPAMSTDPGLLGFQTYGITLVAEQPFWEGTPVVRYWETPKATLPTFPVNLTDDYVLFLTNGLTLAGATVTNPGDEEAFPIWSVTGHGAGLTSATVGIGSTTVTVPFPLADGQSVTINTHRDALTATLDDGTDVTYLLQDAVFASIPTGPNPLTLSLVGDGRITMTLTPLYHRAT